ncbi:hypothetical protein [Anabaena sp. UHCC 0451]|uniref:hypothetical protein n=1 Tax=Anabaena sp. UHCC 0451 TaxID=2055235 RepID=UPI003A4C52D2
MDNWLDMLRSTYNWSLADRIDLGLARLTLLFSSKTLNVLTLLTKIFLKGEVFLSLKTVAILPLSLTKWV